MQQENAPNNEVHLLSSWYCHSAVAIIAARKVCLVEHFFAVSKLGISLQKRYDEDVRQHSGKWTVESGKYSIRYSTVKFFMMMGASKFGRI